MKQLPVGLQIAISFSALVAGLVLLFWLREVDLSFIARFRVLSALLVIASGVSLGIAYGLFVGRLRIVGRMKGPGNILFGLSPLIWMSLIAGIGMAVFANTVGISNFWRIAERMPLDVQKLTGALLMLLIYFFTATEIIVSSVLMLRALKAEPDSAVLSFGSDGAPSAGV